jgi:xanthine/uracil permease
VSLGGVTLVFAILVHTRTAGVIAESAFDVGFIIGFLIWLVLFMHAWRRSVSTPPGTAA